MGGHTHRGMGQVEVRESKGGARKKNMGEKKIWFKFSPKRVEI